jgi:hypothetical protein
MVLNQDLAYPLTRTSAAWLLSWERLWVESKGRLYFWTVTPPGTQLGDKEFARRWNAFGRSMARVYGRESWRGLRVFEPFQSGWLHCHFVIGKRVSWYEVQRIAIRCGLGQVVHVRKAVASDREYLAKYLGKSSGKLSKGVRQWAALGRGWHCRKTDVLIEGEQAAKDRALAAVVGRLGLSPGKRFATFRRLRVLSGELECAADVELWARGLPDIGPALVSVYESLEEGLGHD